MSSFPLLVRRSHLYLGLLCLPWFIMYGISSLAFNHAEWFDAENQEWTEVQSWPCTLSAPVEGAIPKDIGLNLLKIAGMQEAAFGTYRGGKNQINVYLPNFWSTRQLIYKIDRQNLTLVSRPLTLKNFLTSMHGRAGYQHNSLTNDAWAFFVDLTVTGFILWVLSGLYIWWKTPRMRLWGATALGAGIVSFLLFMLLL